MILFLLFLNFRENTIFWSSHYDRLWSSLKSGSYFFCGLNKFCPSIRPPIFYYYYSLRYFYFFCLAFSFFFLLFIIFVVFVMFCRLFWFLLKLRFWKFIIVRRERARRRKSVLRLFIHIIGIYYTKIVLFFFFQIFQLVVVWLIFCKYN